MDDLDTPPPRPLRRQPTTDDKTIVEVKNVSKTYGGDIEALRNVSLACPTGQITTLLGPSGCGKTTLLKIIAGLLEPSGGEVLIEGIKVQGPGPDRAFVFQDFALLPWANVLRNVAYGLELRRVPKKRRHEIAHKYIAEVGLSGFELSYPHQLSGGMRQRVGLARALAVESKIVLMDEPFSSVDEQSRRKFQEDLLALLEIESRTVIFVTHSIEEAVYLSHRVIVLSKRPGSIREVADTTFPGTHPNAIRRDKRYLERVETIWQTLKQDAM